MEQLDDISVRVLAPNPSPMTLDGTNTYVLGAPGSGEVVVVDPGPDLPAHRHAVDRAVAARDADVVAVVVTHHHLDHAQAAGWASAWGATLRCFSPSLVLGALPAGAGPGTPVPTVLRDGDRLRCAGLTIEAMHTPGHASDHLCLRVHETDVLLTGDHVLGRGTSVVAWPDGDMADYLASLRRVESVPASALLPGHGPVLDEPAVVIRSYLDHRIEREQQVLKALRNGDRTPTEVVARIYADVDVALHPAAERGVRAHLHKLVREGRVLRRVEPGSADRLETYHV